MLRVQRDDDDLEVYDQPANGPLHRPQQHAVQVAILEAGAVQVVGRMAGVAHVRPTGVIRLLPASKALIVDMRQHDGFRVIGADAGQVHGAVLSGCGAA